MARTPEPRLASYEHRYRQHAAHLAAIGMISAGTLTRRFGIRQVPALVSQDGLRLRIDELGLP